MSSPATSAALPADVADYISRLSDADTRARQLLAGVTDRQANWRPDNGAAWSIAACLEHMAITNNSYLAALQDSVHRAKSGHVPFAPAGWFSRYFLKKAEPPVTIKIKAPAKIQPPDNINPAEALAHFVASNEAVSQFAASTAGLNLGGVRFKNPFIRGLNFTIATGLLIIAAHNRRHLWQADRVRQARDFPA